MCRWMGYSGGAVPLEELLIEPDVSLIDQSLSSRMGVHPTNGDGFGVGWYGPSGDPGVYRSTHPAWNDANLHDLAHHIESGLFLAHVRRSTGTPVEQSNCHPFRRGRWLFCHNGLIRDFAALKRELLLSVDAELYPDMRGSTDSELIFFLALTFGLERDPFPALEKAAGLVEEVGRKHGVEHPLQMSLGLADGKRLMAVRYSSERQSRTLFHSASINAILALNPGVDAGRFPEDARAIVSEPLSDLEGTWLPVAEATALVAEAGRLEQLPFEPRLP